MRKGVRIKISGRVQGVFFRAISQIEARKSNLSGWIHNDSDGTISIVAEGEDRDLKKFIEWCKYGPDTADVEKVDIRWLPSTDEFSDFVIK